MDRQDVHHVEIAIFAIWGQSRSSPERVRDVGFFPMSRARSARLFLDLQFCESLRRH